MKKDFFNVVMRSILFAWVMSATIIIGLFLLVGAVAIKILK